jgi:CBS-domain-containing membrane protein
LAGGHPVEGGGAAELRVERVVVGDVVAVGAAGAAAKARREVRVADAEGLEVGDERRHLVEAEHASELQAIGRAALAAQRRRRLLEERVGVGHAA